MLAGRNGRAACAIAASPIDDYRDIFDNMDTHTFLACLSCVTCDLAAPLLISDGLKSAQSGSHLGAGGTKGFRVKVSSSSGLLSLSGTCCFYVVL